MCLLLTMHLEFKKQSKKAKDKTFGIAKVLVLQV